MARTRSKHMSPRVRGVLEFIENFISENRYPPTLREICSGTHITSTSVADYYLNDLVMRGKIEREPHVSRGIKLMTGTNGNAMSIGAHVCPDCGAVFHG